MRSLTHALAALSALATVADAAMTVQVQPLNDRIVLVHVDEGLVVHHDRGEQRMDETAVVTPLDAARASDPATYGLSSPDDRAYATEQKPRAVGRKSKGTDYTWAHAAHPRPGPDHAKEHWIYLALPTPLVEGATYELSTGSLVPRTNRHAFRFSAASSRSEAIHVNPIGYPPASPAKFAYVYHWMGDAGALDVAPLSGRPFHLIDLRTGQVAFTGKLEFRAKATQRETRHVSDSPPHGNFAGCDVVQADFTAFDRPGAYVVSIPGVGCSFPFEVAADVYRKVFVPTARGLYHNRSGIALTEPFTEFTRPAPHNPKLTPGFAHRLFYTSVRSMDWPGGEGSRSDEALLRKHIKGEIESSGWYQDAGDWDSYQQHLRVAQELLLVHELAPNRFTDGELNIPESGNGIPDLVDEARWLPSFCQRLRQELLRKGYGSGGIGLRIAGDVFGFDTRPDGTAKASWDDVDRDWVASGEDPWSTFRYAGAAAQMALALQRLGLPDPEGIDWLREAQESYAWAESHVLPADEKREPVYWLYAIRDLRMYAAAGLYRLTREEKYLSRFMADFGEMPSVRAFEARTRTRLDLDESQAALGDEQRYGPWVLLLDPKLPADVRARVEPIVLASAERVGPQVCEQRAMRFGGPFEFDMLVGHQTTPQVLDCAVAYTVLKDRDPARARALLAAVYTSADYCLGTNPLHYTWVTGVGPRHPQHPFHMDAWYNGRGRAHPGIIPYGPWRQEKSQSGQSSTDVSWPYRTLHPAGIENWPGGEQFFENRSSPLQNEFTIHQSTGPAAAIYGFLCADRPASK